MAGTTTATKRAPRTTTRKTTPRKPRSVAVPSDGFEPIRIVTPETPPEVELVEIFSIDDVPYCIPREISPSVGLRFMKMARQTGTEIAMGALLEEMLGAEAYDALGSCKYLTTQQFQDVMDLVRRHAMGAVEGPKGSSRSA